MRGRRAPRVGRRGPPPLDSWDDAGSYREGGWSPAAAGVEDDWEAPAPEPAFGEHIFGVSPVLAALQQRRRKVHALLMQDTIDLKKRKDAAGLELVQRLAVEQDVRIVRTDKGTLNNHCRNRPHQGLALHADALHFEPLAQMPPPRAPEGGRLPLWLALDEVGDPMNLGALLRSAHFLGVDGVLVSEKNSAPLSPTVSKASSGAMEIMPVHATRNLPKTLRSAAEQGWGVVGAALEDSVAPGELRLDRPTVLVLGSEGAGLRTLVRRECDQFVRIPGGAPAAGAPDSVDSLNVSVAGGILLYALLNAARA